MSIPEIPNNNPHVFLEIESDGTDLGRVKIELFADRVPKTTENFRMLCTGEKGVGRSGAKLHYEGCRFHRIIPGFIVQSGDFIGGDGTQNESVYGPCFEDENFTVKHDEPGIVSMANRGRNTNGGQFFITLRAIPTFDKHHVAFGKVVEGMDVIERIAEAGSSNGAPTRNIKIKSCGEV